MKIFSTVLVGLFILLSHFNLSAEDVILTSSDGESFVVDLETSKPFSQVLEELKTLLVIQQEGDQTDSNPAEEITIIYKLGQPSIYASKGSKQKGPRNYASPASGSEKENIRYVIRSLAKYNWTQLAKEESALRKAGDKINHVHPLRFLQCIFTDEELKAGIYVIRNKNLVWGDYYEGMKRSLNEESDNNNLIQFAPDFALQVGVDLNAIMPYLQARQWAGLVDLLIASIPRQGNPDRYGM